MRHRCAASAMPLRLRSYVEPFTLRRSPWHPAGGPVVCVLEIADGPHHPVHCAFLNAYLEPQLTRNRSVVPPLPVQNCCVNDSPRLHSALPSLSRSGSALSSVGTCTLRRSHRHFGGRPKRSSRRRCNRSVFCCLAARWARAELLGRLWRDLGIPDADAITTLL